MDNIEFKQRFGIYNKDIISQRTLFFNNCQTSDLEQLISDLQYETSSLKKNFRWGQRYFNNSKEEFTWLSSINGTIKSSFFNKSTHEKVTYDKKVFYNINTLKEHILSHNGPKRKLSLFYNMADAQKKDLNNYSNALINLYMISKKTYGLSQKSESDVLWIDLDNHIKDVYCDSIINNEAISKLKTLLELFNISLKDFLYIEANVFTGGIHCALKLPFKVDKNSNFYQEFERELNKYVTAECNFQTKLLRLPLSFEYLPLKRNLDLEKIASFSKEHFIESFDETLKCMNYNPINIDIFLKTNIIDISDNERKLIKIRQKLLQEKNNIKDYWNTPKTLFIRANNNKIIKTKELYKIKEGHRWDTFKVLIPYLKMAGKSYEEILNILQIQNINSKDMKEFDKLKKEIKSFYDNIRIKSKSFGIYQTYISNESFLSDITKEFFNDEDFQRYLTDRFIKNYVKVRNYKNNFVSEEKYQILLKQIPYMIKEIIGKMYYDINNPKQFINKKLNHYNGFQLSYKHLEKIQEQSIKDLNLKDNPLNKTSLQYLKKALLLTLDIEEIENTNKGKRNWIKGSCKSFRINSINDIENILKHFYNSCFRDIVTNNFIIKNKKIYTLYISLIDNNGFINYEDEIYIKNHIPIINDS